MRDAVATQARWSCSFAQGPWPAHVRAMPDAVSAWLTAQLPG